MPKNLLLYGDNHEMLRHHVADESVDLVYLDPPFNSKADYNVLFAEQDGSQSVAQIQAFGDTWSWGLETKEVYERIVEGGGAVGQVMQSFWTFLGGSNMMAYLTMMGPRLVELRRVLKPTGSIYLHCDPTASHYLKLLMDAVFAPEHYRNEIVWKRHNARSTDGRWPRIHDILLFYSKSDVFTFHALEVTADKAKMPHTLIAGADGQKYQTYELTGPGVTKEGDSGKPWHGFDPTAMGRHWGNNHSTMDGWDAAGLIHWPKPGKMGGFPRRRGAEPFVAEDRTITVGDMWTDIDRINQSAKERLGYPTQKPEALLDRIIRASSNQGDTVLDPFCGCGTAIASAQRLNRRWVGIDITHLAITLIKHRLQGAFGEEIKKAYEAKGEPTDLAGAEALALEDRYQFQWWAVGMVGARPTPTEQKKGSDKGIDGRLYFHDESETGKPKQVILSVKSGNIKPGDVRDLHGTVDREKAAVGVLLTLHEPTKPMTTTAAEAGFYSSPGWNKKYPRLQILSVADLLAGKSIDMPPQKQTNVTFKKAPRAKPGETQTQTTIPFGSPVDDESE